MYIAETSHNPEPLPPPSIDFSAAVNHHGMSIEIVPSASRHHLDGGPNRMGPKKRAEIWVQGETRTLISLRKEMDSLFNTSKSNKHLWEQISTRMREKGFDRSPTMCTDKWRNLLKEFKKVKHHLNNGVHGNGNGSAKMSYYKEIEEILRERSSFATAADGTATAYKSPTHSGNLNHTGNHSPKIAPFLQFSDKGIDDANIPFGPIEAGPVTEDDETRSYGGRVITVKWGNYIRRVGVEGTADAIKDVIRSAFGLRTKRAFWLEDEDQVVRSLDRDMPLSTYTLHLDEGMRIKLLYEESGHIPYPSETMSHTEEKTFYTEEDFRDFMRSCGWSSLRELNGYRNIDNLDDLRLDALYRGVT